MSLVKQGAQHAGMTPPEAARVYTFAAFRLDVQQERLMYGVEHVPLTDRLFRILLALVKANGALVSRDELHALIWPDDLAQGNNLAQHVYMLRRILGERAGDRLYIATVHRKGFRFVSPVGVIDSMETPKPVAASPHAQPPVREPELIVLRNFTRASKLLDAGMAADLRSASELFSEAIAREPDYVPSLVGLARTHLLLTQFGYSAKHLEYPHIRDAISEALRLDRESATAHAVLANVLLFCDWNWREAHREIDLAVQYSPENTVVRTCASWIHAWTGHPERAAREAKRALMSDPSSTALQLLLGRVLTYCGDPYSAIEYLSEVIQISAQLAVPARRCRALAWLMSGHPHEALLDLTIMPEDRAEDLAGRLSLLGQAHAMLGDKGRARQLYHRLSSAAQIEFVPESSLLLLALANGDIKLAIEHLQKATDQKEPLLPIMRHWELLRSLRKTDQFKELASEIGSC